MKVLVIILSALLLGSNLWAEERKVELNKNKEFQPNRSEYSIPLSVTQDDNLVNLTSTVNVADVYFTVKTVVGEVVLSDVISLPANQTYTFSLGNVESDVYILEVKINGELYYGYLEIY